MRPQQPTVQHSVVHPKPAGRAKGPGHRQRVPLVADTNLTPRGKRRRK